MFATEAEKSKRMDTCNTCPHMKVTLIGKKCGDCGCILALKILKSSEVCPKNKW